MCPVSVLRKHSAGSKFAPVAVTNGFRLINASGDVLVGYRGKVFEFNTHKNAIDWIKTNLARYGNKTQDTSIDFLLQLGAIYIETGFEPCNQAIKDIYDFEHGIWKITEYGDSEIILQTDFNVDGGNAFTTY